MKPADKLGIYGGTFDPIHNGHIQSVLDSAKKVGVDEILLIPAHIPPHKNAAVASSHHRLAMVELVCQHHQMFKADDRELKRNAPSYTSETLAELVALYPAKQLLLFIGMDSLLTFTQWHRWQNILTLCHLIVSARPNFNHYQADIAIDSQLIPHIAHQVSELNKAKAGKIFINNTPDFAVSSTEIRSQIRQSAQMFSHVPDYIRRYIIEHQLYQ